MELGEFGAASLAGATTNKGSMAMRSTGRHWRRRSRSRSTKSWQRPTKEARNPSQRRGLRKLSSDFIGKAADETATQVTRIGLTFLGTSAFCLLSLLSPDSALLGGSERINVPFAGPVSFFGFMLLGPAVLIVLRVYLQIYIEHSERLERLARSMSIARAPMLVPLQNPLIRYFSGLIFYLLLPLTMLLLPGKPPYSRSGARVCLAWRQRSSPAISCCRSRSSLGDQRRC
jgi:hypothetical protein